MVGSALEVNLPDRLKEEHSLVRGHHCRAIRPASGFPDRVEVQPNGVRCRSGVFEYECTAGGQLGRNEGAAIPTFW